MLDNFDSVEQEYEASIENQINTRITTTNVCAFCYDNNGELIYDISSDLSFHVRCLSDKVDDSDPLALQLGYLLVGMGLV